jgi:hypothetical protein
MIQVNPTAPSALALQSIGPRLALVFFILGFAACASEHSHHQAGGPLGPEDAKNNTPIPRMEADGMFFDGQVEVETLLARAGATWTRDADQASASASSKGGGGLGGGFGGGHGGGRHGGGGGRGGGDSGRTQDDTTQQAPPIHASNGPVVQLRVRLTNHGPEPVTVEVVDFDSTLGNFVVQPEKITVQPGASVEADPMVSRLGMGTGEIPLTLKLRIAERSDQQVLTLRVVTEATPAIPRSP